MSSAGKDDSVATQSPVSAGAGTDTTGKGAQEQRKKASNRRPEASPVSRIVSSIPTHFWVILIGVGLVGRSSACSRCTRSAVRDGLITTPLPTC